jgi:FdhD protein
MLNEGIIQDLAQIGAQHVCAAGTCVDIWLRHAVSLSPRRILTSGCAGGVTLADLARARPPVDSALRLPAAQIGEYMQALHLAMPLHQQTGGTHATALIQAGQIISQAEDIGRHNTLDKIRGDCARRGLDTRQGVLVTTGRISSEMLNKAAAMDCPIVISRTTPTSMAVQMARAWNVTLIGYVRGQRATIYAAPERIIFAPDSAGEANSTSADALASSGG